MSETQEPDDEKPKIRIITYEEEKKLILRWFYLAGFLQTIGRLFGWVHYILIHAAFWCYEKAGIKLRVTRESGIYERREEKRR